MAHFFPCALKAKEEMIDPKSENSYTLRHLLKKNESLVGYCARKVTNGEIDFMRWFKQAAQPSIKVPFFGAISYLTLAVLPFCIVFAVVWAVYREYKFAWIGQYILGIALIITVLQIVYI
ncbi:hypothetical protein L1887_19333 [Cichorium endivia]|nr:hypothetical protein L1887_19333 [Cichorium endivia]